MPSWTETSTHTSSSEPSIPTVLLPSPNVRKCPPGLVSTIMNHPRADVIAFEEPQPYQFKAVDYKIGGYWYPAVPLLRIDATWGAAWSHDTSGDLRSMWP